MNCGILVVAEQRELRRRLFDTLAPLAHAPIHSARGVSHAAILLEGSPDLQLIVIVFEGDAEQAQATIDRLRSLPGTGEVPLIAVLTAESTLAPVDLPAGIIDWLHEGQIKHELLARWRRSLDRCGALVAATPAPGSDVTGVHSLDDYRGLLDEADIEWLIIATDSRRILAVSPTLLRNSQLPAGHWRGLPLTEALRLDDAVAVAFAECDDAQWQRCWRQSSQDADAGQASVRPIRYAGQPALAIVFRADRADLRAESALKLLSRTFASSRGADASAGVAQLLFDELELDYLGAPGAGPDFAGRIHSAGRRDRADRVGGEWVMRTACAQRL